VFFALWPSRDLAACLAAVAGDLAGRFGGRPTRQETIHLTLAFLGEVAEERLPQLLRCAAELRLPSFALAIDTLACWERQHLLWAGCSRISEPLLLLVEALRAALAKAGFAADAGRSGFTPHLSLVRRLPETGMPSGEQLQPLISPQHWSCQRFVLVRSRLSSVGPDYQTIAEFPLVP